MQHRQQLLPIGEVVSLIANGEMALPEFQRDFVWDPNKVAELLDSVANGWPIGSLLLLEGPQPFGIKAISGGPKTIPETVSLFILDGQQRVTSLFHALRDRGDVIYFVDLEPEENSSDVTFEWAKRERGIPAERRGTCFTVAALVSDTYEYDLPSTTPEVKKAHLREARTEKLGALLDTKHSVPATVMRQGIELVALTRIFETLNRTGVRLDAFDLMVATLYPDGFHLREAWESGLNELTVLDRLGANGLEVLKLIALWRWEMDSESGSPRRVTGVRQRDVLNIPPRFVKENWERAINAYARAFSFLEESARVTNRSAIPSEAMAINIAHLIDAGKPEADVSRWFWQAVAMQRFAQGANTQVIAEAANWPTWTTHDALMGSLAVSLGDRWTRNRILRLGLRGALLKNGALDLITGEPLLGNNVRTAWLDDFTPPNDDTQRLTGDLVLLNTHTPLLGHRSDPDGRPGLPPYFNPEALTSQGLPVAFANLSLEEVRASRNLIIMDIFKELT